MSLLPLTRSQALEKAKEYLAETDGLRVSEAKVMLTVLVWYLSRAYEDGFELTPQRGEELPAATGPRSEDPEGTIAHG